MQVPTSAAIMKVLMFYCNYVGGTFCDTYGSFCCSYEGDTLSLAIMQLCNYAEKVGALVENIFVAPWLLFFEPFKMDVVEHCSSIIPK